MENESIIQGKMIAPGITIDKPFVFAREAIEIPQYTVGPDEAAQELASYCRAQEAVRQEMQAELAGQEADAAEICRTHILMLEDPDMDGQIRDAIQNGGANAAKAADAAYREFAGLMAAMEDPYLRQRASDLHDVRLRLLRKLLRLETKDYRQMRGVLAASELLPSDFQLVSAELLTGIVTEQDETASHAAIIARSLNIPVLFAVKNAVALAKAADTVILDGGRGSAIFSPLPETAERYSRLQADFQKSRAIQERYLSARCATADGAAFTIEVNEGSVSQELAADALHADGVGLFRTELLYMDSAMLPDEQTQLSAYRAVLQSFSGKPVIIRTLDIGADKQLPYLTPEKEENPALGNRALRFCLSHRELFRTQLRALLRASAYGELWIMFPMIGGIEDFRAAKKALLEVQEELQAEEPGLRCAVRLGIMIEIPSAALTADVLAAEADFASIGTNDLTQYAEAVDRVGRTAGDYYRPLHPALLRMIHYAAQSFDRAGKPIGVCGELAGTPEGAIALASLGIRQLSMDRSALAAVKYTLAQFRTDELSALGRQLLAAATEEQVRHALRSRLQEKGIMQ